MPRGKKTVVPTETELMRQAITNLQEQMRTMTTAIQAIAGQRPPPPAEERDERVENTDDESDIEENPFAALRNQRGRVRDADDYRWESAFKLEIPEFHGGQLAEELLDWIVTVEEILEFKRVPLERCVPVIAMRFRNHAAAWWTQLKLSRARL
ncbi:hypothetical protein EUTSA_v10015528mg, partial [Eutrema salsugineum]